jgi:hypothetical protein
MTTQISDETMPRALVPIGTAHFVGVAFTPEMIEYLAALTSRACDPHDRVSMACAATFARVLADMRNATQEPVR